MKYQSASSCATLETYNLCRFESSIHNQRVHCAPLRRSQLLYFDYVASTGFDTHVISLLDFSDFISSWSNDDRSDTDIQSNFVPILNPGQYFIDSALIHMTPYFAGWVISMRSVRDDSIRT